MHRRIWLRRTLMAVIIVPLTSILVLAGAVALTRFDPASGDVNAMGGGAFGESVNVHSLLGTTLTSGPTPSVTLPPVGGGPFQDHLASANVPSLLAIGVLDVSTQGTAGASGSVVSSADVANLSLLSGAATADLVKSTCTVSTTGSSASSTITHLAVAGITVPVDPAPNTTVTIPLVGALILNEQTVSTVNGSTDITVNAIHLKLNSAVLGTGDIIIAQSRCQLSAPSTPVPVGAVGGLGLAAVVGVVFFWKVTRRRPERDGSNLLV